MEIFYETNFGGKKTMIRCNINIKSVSDGTLLEERNTRSFSWPFHWEVTVLNVMKKTHATMETQ